MNTKDGWMKRRNGKRSKLGKPDSHFRRLTHHEKSASPIPILTLTSSLLFPILSYPILSFYPFLSQHDTIIIIIININLSYNPP